MVIHRSFLKIPTTQFSTSSNAMWLHVAHQWLSPVAFQFPSSFTWHLTPWEAGSPQMPIVLQYTPYRSHGYLLEGYDIGFLEANNFMLTFIAELQVCDAFLGVHIRPAPLPLSPSNFFVTSRNINHPPTSSQLLNVNHGHPQDRWPRMLRRGLGRWKRILQNSLY